MGTQSLAESERTIAQRIIAALRDHGPKDDDELAAIIHVRRQSINSVARTLERKGLLIRTIGERKTVNTLASGADVERLLKPSPEAAAGPLMGEEAVKRAVYDFLCAQGYQGRMVALREHGADIDMSGPGGRIIVEAKGEAPPGAQQVNYFLHALGELVQRMHDPEATYAIALPDNKQFRGLVSSLPAHARERLQLTIFFVGGDGVVRSA